MIRVVGYISGVPPGIKNQHKREIVSRFIQGVRAAGDDGFLQTSNNIVQADVAFIQGWVHEGSDNAPHLLVRKRVIENQRIYRKHTIVVDSNLFNYADPENKDRYLRYSCGGVFPTTANYFWDDPDPSRWQQISRDQGISLKDWRTKGSHILICTQRPGGWSMKGLEVNQWLNQTIAEIRKYSDRPILVRSHPGAKGSKDSVTANNKQGLYSISTNKLIVDDFKNAHAVITYNSSPGVAAAIEGIPVFVTDPNPRISQAFEVSNYDLSLLESPLMPDRQSWVEKISMSHWNNIEVQSGQAWRHIKKFISSVV